MATKFELNGKEITAKEFDYNLMCDMEEMGFNIEEFGEKPLSALRGYIALCKNCTVKKAGEEISDHMANGGDVEDILEVMTEKLNTSDFFRGQQTDKKKKTTKD